MNAKLVLTLIALSVAAAPVASAGPNIQCSAEPDVWYETCQPIADEINENDWRETVTDLVLCLTLDHSKCPR